jgi:hypothetical protein
MRALSLRSNAAAEHYIDSKLLPSAQSKLQLLNEMNRAKWAPPQH